MNINEIIDHLSDILQVRVHVEGRYKQGFSNTVFRAAAEDGTPFCIRVPVDAEAAKVSQRGTRLLLAVKEKIASIQVPRVLYADINFLVLEHLPGQSLDSWCNQTISSPDRRSILDGIASFFHMLWSVDGSIENNVGYRTWLYGQIDKALLRSLTCTDRKWGHPCTFIQRRMFVECMPLLPCEDRPVIQHGDLNACNVIVEGGRLSGIIDWDTAQQVPAGAGIKHALFISDIPGYHNAGTQVGETFADDRAYLENALQTLCASHASSNWMLALLQNSQQRQFLEMSLTNRSVNHEFCARELAASKYDRQLASRHLMEFLDLHDDMRANAQVIEMQDEFKTLDTSLSEDSIRGSLHA